MVIKIKKITGTNNSGNFAIFALFVLFCFANSKVYAEYLFPSASSFIIKDISEEAENDLEWVEYHVNMADDEYRGGSESDYPYDEYFQEYTLYNNGDVTYTVRIGVGYQYRSEAPNSLFKINDVPVEHQIDWQLYNPFLFIDVVFPPHERTKIRVNDLSYTRGFDETTNQTPAFAFKGTPRFTATIGNYFLDEEHHDFGIEKMWIDDVYIYIYIAIDSIQKYSLTAMIAEEGPLPNRFFSIRKTNENTWDIEFTTAFVDKYRNWISFDIEWGRWGYDVNGNDIGLHFNIEEELSPYRYLFLTNKQLQVVRNAYYARHGYIFKNPALQRMYEGFEFPRFSRFGNIYYVPNPNFHEDMLTDIDRANIEIIRRLETLEGDIVDVVKTEQNKEENALEETSASTPADSEKSTKSILYIVIISGIAALAAVVVFIVLKMKEK